MPAVTSSAPAAAGRRADLIWPLLAAALWGGMYVVSQLAFASLPPATLGLARLLVGVPVLLLFLRRMPAWRERRLALLGAVLASSLLLQFWGTDLAGAAAGSVVTLSTPLFVAALAPLLLGERTRPRQWAGVVIGVAGAALVAGGDLGTVAGDVLLLLGALTWALYTVLGAPLVRRRGALEVTAVTAAWAIPWTAVAAALELARTAVGPTGPGLVAAVLYLGVGATALGWWAWQRGMQRLPAVTAGVFFLAQPVVGVALSVPVFGIHPGPVFLVGAALVAAGSLLAL